MKESLARFRTIYGKEGAAFKLPNGVNFENIPFYNNYVNTLSALRALVFTANNVQTERFNFIKLYKSQTCTRKNVRIGYDY